jgi:hypothetical protein
VSFSRKGKNTDVAVMGSIAIRRLASSAEFSIGNDRLSIPDESIIIPFDLAKGRRLSNVVESRQVGYANIHRYKSATFSEIAHAFVYHRIPCVILCAYLACVIMQCTFQ